MIRGCRGRLTGFLCGGRNDLQLGRRRGNVGESGRRPPNCATAGSPTPQTILATSALTLVLAVWCASAATAQAPGRRPIQPDDLYRFDAPTAAVSSPDGKRVAYIRQWIDERSREERQSLWVVDVETGAGRAREAGEPDARGPVFSPDGRWIAFRSTRSRDSESPPIPATPPESETATDIWLIRPEGGPAIPLVAGPRPYGRVFGDPFYGRLAFSPDGASLVFVADDGREPRGRDEIEADVFVERPDQGEGYTGWGAASIWIAELDPAADVGAARSIRRLTPADAWYGDPQWTPDGRAIVAHANRTDDRESVRFSINKNYDLWRIDVKSGEVRQLTFGPGPEVSPRIAPDGRRLVCLSSPRKGPHADVFNFALVTLDADPPTTRILFDHHVDRDDESRPPHPYPAFPLPDPFWEDDARGIYSANVGVETRNVQLDVAGGAGEVLTGPAAKQRSGILRRQAERAGLLPEANEFLKSRLASETRVVRWKSGDGWELEGVLTTPPPEVARPPYRLLLHPHGGPHSRSTTGFNFTVDCFAARGYAVFQPNFRGSQGYGRKFLDADRGDFGGGDMRDVLTGIEKLIEAGTVDRDRQFVYGVSYGGFMTTWLVGQTRQFRAAVAQNAVTDLAMMWGLGDLPSWTEWEFGGPPWETAHRLARHSPLSYVDRVATPTLVLHSREDRRCPLPMGLAYYRALERRGVPSQMVVYPGEGHGIRRPRHREDVLRRTLDWFERHDPAARPGSNSTSGSTTTGAGSANAKTADSEAAAK